VQNPRSIGRSSGGLAYELAGGGGIGDPVVLLHAGVADRRMWDPNWPQLIARHRVLRYDARGYGESLPPTGPWSQHGDLLGLLEELGIGRAHVVGVSMGAGIAVEAALAQPSRVASLILAAPGGALYGDTTEDLRAIWHAEVEALDRGDRDAAVEINLRAWVDGPARRPDEVDPEVRAFVGRMQRDAFELPEWDPDDAPESELEPPAANRLAELACPTLVIVGEGDQAASLQAADRLVAMVPRVDVVRWPVVGHMLPLERPDDFAALVLAHLAAVE
jgi:pimeloyl-ACP methyl ester carboxylesterase